MDHGSGFTPAFSYILKGKEHEYARCKKEEVYPINLTYKSRTDAGGSRPNSLAKS